MMTIEEQVNDGIKNAMKAHDKVRLETMRQESDFGSQNPPGGQ